MPTHDHIVIEDPTGARATVALVSVPDHKLRGFRVIGPAVAPGDPRTPAEAADAEDAHTAAIAAAAAEAAAEPGIEPAETSPAKPRGSTAVTKKEK